MKKIAKHYKKNIIVICVKNIIQRYVDYIFSLYICLSI